MFTVGLPRTVDRMHDSETVYAPDSWLAPMLPSVAHGFPARRLHHVQPVTIIGEFMSSMLAHQNQAR